MFCVFFFLVYHDILIDLQQNKEKKMHICVVNTLLSNWIHLLFPTNVTIALSVIFIILNAFLHIWAIYSPDPQALSKTILWHLRH